MLSGKGGVGKSTFSVMLAQALAMGGDDVENGEDDTANGDAGHGNNESGSKSNDKDINGRSSIFGTPDSVTVGLMDADICGPSVPKMVGVEEETVHVSGDGWQPVWADDNLCVMSVQFMLPSRDDAIVWRGAKKNGLIKKFLRDVEWGTLDYLVVDTPPGTSDEHLTVAAMLREATNMAASETDSTSGTNGTNGKGLDGAVLVTTPQEVALLDVRKEIDFCRKAGIRILGLVENMSGFVCPNCRHETQIFKPSTGGAERLAKDTKIPFLGAVPLDPRVGMACDYGESLFQNFPNSPACKALRGVVQKVLENI